MNAPGEKTQVKPIINLAFAKTSDGLALAKVMLLAFKDDPNSFAFHPERVGLSAEENFEIHGPAAARDLQRKIVGTDVYVKASIQMLGQNGGIEETIVGWASWKTPLQRRVVPRTLWEWILAWVIYPLREHLFRRRASPPLPSTVRTLMQAQYDATFGLGGLAEGQKPWYLSVLCVDPKWQGIGAGKALLNWGMDNARRDNVPIYLESSPRATEFYISSGFEYTVIQSCSANGYIVRVPGMIWFPTAKKIL